MRRYLLTEGQVNEFDGETVPEAVQIIFVARWLQGAASIEWLADHPDWYEWADICSIAQTEAEAQRMKDSERG